MKAPAKLNLFLHVAPPRSDGLHELFSLAAFTEFGDEVSVSYGADLNLAVEGPFADDLRAQDDDDNLVWRAARALEAWCGENGQDAPGAAIRLVKHLPVASGLGGGSSDAAAALRALAAHWTLSLSGRELHRIALSLGADVPVCLDARPAWMKGIGDAVEPGPKLPRLAVVLVNPRIALSTREVYLEFDRMGCPGTELAAAPLPASLSTLDAFLEYVGSRNNDLEAPARALERSIGRILHELDRTGAALSRMSGSGATCFGIYDRRAGADEAAEAISADHPDWWVKATELAT